MQLFSSFKMLVEKTNFLLITQTEQSVNIKISNYNNCNVEMWKTLSHLFCDKIIINKEVDGIF